MSIKCKLCNVEAIVVNLNLQGYKESDFYTIMNCPSCLSSFPSNQNIDSNIYNFIYKNINKIPGYNRYYSYFNNIKNSPSPLNYLADSEAAYWAINNILNKDSRKKSDIKILEIGCGLGYLTYSLNYKGYHAIGIDISYEAVDKAIENFGNNYLVANILEDSELIKFHYDYVIMTELIEHIENPKEMIDAACQYLSSSGKLLITTPNKDFYNSDVIWKTELPPIHVWWFSERFFTILGEILNLNVYFLDFTQWNKKWLDRSRINRNQNIVRNPIINQKYEIIDYNISTASSLKGILLIILSRLKLTQVFRRFAIIFYQLLSKDINKHEVMCIILEKK